jgi:hypothetical protein
MSSPAVESQARRYLRFFPAWMRADRGEEAVGLVLDQLPDDVDRLPLRAKADLVRAGLHARRRGRPPLRVWRTVCGRPTTWTNRDAAVPVEWRPWLITAVQQRSLVWRVAFIGDPSNLLYMAPFWWWLLRDAPAPGITPYLFLGALALVTWLLSGIGFMVFRRRVWRARLLQSNGLDDAGRPLPPSLVTTMWVRPGVRNARVAPALGAAAVGAAIAVPFVVGWLSDQPLMRHSGSVEVCGAVIALSALASVCWVAWRARRIDRTPSAWSRPDTGWGQFLALTIGAGALAGATTTVLAGMYIYMLEVRPILCASVPVAATSGAVAVMAVERVVGRPVGVWDLSPSSAPRQLVRRLQDLPRPPQSPQSPQSPDRPALG